jgi:acetylglutamate kinase
MVTSTDKSRILLKLGGLSFEGEDGFKDLARSIQSNSNIEIIIVHGGGAEISQALKDACRKTVFIDGIRVTQAEDIKIVEDVLSNTINRRIADWLSQNGISCRRLSGRTERLFVVEPLTRQGHSFGYVGKIKQVNADVVLSTLKEGLVPVVSPISSDEKGESYNVNADTAAAALAGSANCRDLVFITDVPGVLLDGQTCPSLTVREVKNLIADGTISGGMVAKMEAAFAALDLHVPRVHIIQWQGPETLKCLIDREETPGTTIHR